MGLELRLLKIFESGLSDEDIDKVVKLTKDQLINETVEHLAREIKYDQHKNMVNAFNDKFPIDNKKEVNEFVSGLSEVDVNKMIVESVRVEFENSLKNHISWNVKAVVTSVIQDEIRNLIKKDPDIKATLKAQKEDLKKQILKDLKDPKKVKNYL